MKIAKWVFVFVIAFIVAWILIFTFLQEPFQQRVPALLLWYRTPGLPIYAFVVAAFAVGIILGFLMTAYYYVVGQAGIYKKNQTIRSLEVKLQELNSELERIKQGGDTDEPDLAPDSASDEEEDEKTADNGENFQDRHSE